MNQLIASKTRSLMKCIECILAIGILAGIAAFSFHSTLLLASLDWNQTTTFYELINRILLIVIGVELVRTLVTHDLESIVELLAIVIARKLLRPDLANYDIILSVSAFAALLASRKYLLLSPSGDAKLPE